MCVNLSLLTEIPLFSGMRTQEIEKILCVLKITESHFKKGEILALQDEPCNRLIVLLSGSVKGEMIGASGKAMKVEEIPAPCSPAILFLFGRENRFPVQITACRDVSALVINKQSVLEMLKMNEVLLKNYLDISADFASKLSKKLFLMSFQTIRQKVAAHLLDLSAIAQSDTVELGMTKTALAGYFGVARQSLERELTLMCGEGLISIQGKKIGLADKNGLVRLVRF